MPYIVPELTRDHYDLTGGVNHLAVTAFTGFKLESCFFEVLD